MTERAQKVLDYLKNLSPNPQIWIRQATLAEHFNCSRRTIGRCLKELKEAGLLTDLNKRHENRCKMYCLEADKNLTPEAQRQWELYEKTFRILFKMPNFEQLYAEVTWNLDGIKDDKELWSKTFAGLWAITGTAPTEKVFDPQRNAWFYRLIPKF